MNEITVHVVKYPKRPNLVMRYVDPMTGKQKTKSAGTPRRREAEKVAAKWEAELREGRYNEPSKVTWADFREKYEDEVLSGLAENTYKKVIGVFNMIEDVLSPKRLYDLTAQRLSYWQSELRKGGRAEDTIKGHTAHLVSALRRAVDWGMLPELPKVTVPHRAKKVSLMKGRPLAGEEFERMLSKTVSVVGEAAALSWLYYLRGLWLSGLRLEESLDLYWDRDDRLSVDLSGKLPMLRITGEFEKGHKDRLLPMAPEFAEFLLQTPEHLRKGRVFDPMARKRRAEHLTASRVGRLVTAIGKAAGVVVKREGDKVKYASAQDLRRSFGERWAPRVMPQVLKELMRHESIETTLKYYVGSNAQATADILWEAHSAAGSISGNIAPDGLEFAEHSIDVNALQT